MVIRIMFSIDYPDTAIQNVILATNNADIYAINYDVIFRNHYGLLNRWLNPHIPLSGS